MEEQQEEKANDRVERSFVSEDILEPEKQQQFVPTEEQITVCKEISKELADLMLIETNVSIDPSISAIRFDVLARKAKRIYSIFVFPDGNIEVDLYTTSNVSKEGQTIKKERDMIYSKPMTLKELKRQLLFSARK
jgi:hypothetical protein